MGLVTPFTRGYFYLPWVTFLTPSHPSVLWLPLSSEDHSLELK